MFRHERIATLAETKTPAIDNEKKVAMIEDAIQTYLTPSLDEFADSPEHQPFIDDDKAYVAEQAERFEQRGDKRTFKAVALESIIQYGISHDLIFKSTGSNKNNHVPRYKASQIWPTKYDDYKNRVDAAFVLDSNFKNSEGYWEKFTSPIALDITASNNRRNIAQKILVSSNDNTLGHHVGFTDIRYCKTEGKNGDSRYSYLRGVPRYCIGVDQKTIDGILDHMSIAEDGTLSFGTQYMATTYFKIIYEIIKQNDLYLAPLQTADQIGNLTDEEKDIKRQLEMINFTFNHELQRLVEGFPAIARRRLGRPSRNGVYRPDKVARLFRKPKSLFYDQSFTAIIEATEGLHQGLQDCNPDEREVYLAERSFDAVRDKISGHESNDPESIEATDKLAEMSKRSRAMHFQTNYYHHYPTPKTPASPESLQIPRPAA